MTNAAFFDKWIRAGVEQGWCSEPVCATHEGVPGTEWEEAELEEGYDPCQHVVRLWPQGVEGEEPAASGFGEKDIPGGSKSTTGLSLDCEGEVLR